MNTTPNLQAENRNDFHLLSGHPQVYLALTIEVQATRILAIHTTQKMGVRRAWSSGQTP
ncbi:MAG: hypothetical protein ACK5YR_07015 [Pirellula sp.]|jgi:hypothetical protein